jgi:hypothetical protein
MIESKNWKVDGRKIIYDSIGKISQEDSYQEGKLNGQETTYFTRIIWHKMKPDIFNRLHKSFPREKRLITN